MSICKLEFQANGWGKKEEMYKRSVKRGGPSSAVKSLSSQSTNDESS